jgi:GxxExxY protein
MDQWPLEELIPEVIGCMIAVHKELGPGFIESVYHRALEVELERCGISYDTEKEVPICYQGRDVGIHRLDLFVAGALVVELKAVEEIAAIHYAKVRSYLKAVGQPVGLLANFAAATLDCRRVERKYSPT